MGSRSAIEGTQQEASSGPRSLKAELAYKHASALHNDARFKPVLDYFTGLCHALPDASCCLQHHHPPLVQMKEG